MRRLIDAIATAVPATLVEIAKLGRTLKRRATDVLAYFEHPGTSNGPTEAINGLLEHLRGSALGFRNLDLSTTVEKGTVSGGWKGSHWFGVSSLPALGCGRKAGWSWWCSAVGRTCPSM